MCSSSGSAKGYKVQDSLAVTQSLPKQTHKPQRVGHGLMGRTTHRATHSGFKEGSVASQRVHKIATPLCLPSNCKWDSRSGQCIKTAVRRDSLYVVEKALQNLRKIKGPVCVVAIAGPCKKGKSWVLSQAFNQPEVFPLGHEMVAETMGIWLWIVPEKYRDSRGREFTVVLLDSEGRDAVTCERLDDDQIFTLTVLLSSVVIYNSQGVPTRRDLEGLDFIVKLPHLIEVCSTTTQGTRKQHSDSQYFYKTFPYFIWLLRDVTQAIPSDCSNLKEYFLKKLFKEQYSSAVAQEGQKVAESILSFFPGFEAFTLPCPTIDTEMMKSITDNKDDINPLFFSRLEEFKSLLWNVLVPKNSFNDGEVVTGEGLAALVQLYVEAINTPGVIPNVQSAWETFVVTKCSEAANAALKAYDVIVASRLAGSLPCDNEEIRNSHEAAFERGIAQLEAETMGISAVTTENYLRELTEALGKKLARWQSENERLTKQSCTSLLKQLKKEHLDPLLTQLHGGGGAKVMFVDLVAGYNRIKHDYKARASGAKDVSAAVFFECHLELMKEMQQYLDVLRQMKDFDENLGREVAAKACQEQEITKLEEEIARLQQENREQQMKMEMLQAKQQEEKKRLRKQMEAEAKAQRDQMDNMMKANMKQAEEDRRAFIQDNPALNQHLEMQELSEGIMQQRIENLRQLVHQIGRHEVDASCSVM